MAQKLSVLYAIKVYVFSTRRDCERDVKSNSHQKNISGIITNDEFFFDLCVMFCACNLAWNLVDHTNFKHFLKKYVPNFPLPRITTLRKQYLPCVYANTIGNIKEDV